MSAGGLGFTSIPSIDQPLVVEAARMVDLRYEHARIEAKVGADGVVDFRVERAGEHGHFRYQVIGDTTEAAPESLEFFLLERYRLFASNRATGKLTSIRVAHAPYRYAQPLVFDWADTPLWLAGFTSPGRDPDHIVATEPVEVETFAPEVVSPGR
jgi:uncharacterized protein YqjF (DUF2071 family)